MLQEINTVSVCLRVGLALLLGALLGIERGRKNRPAGMRTYMLVCLGAAIVMMTNQFVFQTMGVSDPVRMGAQVISGVGFLGAGTIIFTNRKQVKGITTAAGLWAAACSGLAIGIGFYVGAAIGGLAAFLVMSVMQKLDAVIHSNSRMIDIYLEYRAKKPFGHFLTAMRELDFEIIDIQFSQAPFESEDYISMMFTAKSQEQRTHAEMLELMGGVEGVCHIQEVQ